MIIWNVFLPAGLLHFLSVVALANGSTLVADFDSFPEGPIATEFVDGGIRFSNLDVDLPGGPFRFVIEWSEIGGLAPFFSPPNYLAFTGYSPGPAGGGLSRFASISIDVPGTATSAQIDAFNPRRFYSGVLNLTAFLNGVEVATVRAVSGEGTPLSSFAEHHLLRIDGPRFDSLRMFATDKAGTPSYALTAVDNVRIGGFVPEPSSASLVLLFLACISRLRATVRHRPAGSLGVRAPRNTDES